MSDPSEHKPIEPKPPEFLQNLKWLKLHGWRYKWRLLTVGFLIIPLLLPQVRQYVSELRGLLSKGQSVPHARHGIPSKSNLPWMGDSQKTEFLSTQSTPDQILQTLAQFSFITKQDALILRRGSRVRASGKIVTVTEGAVVLGDASFETIP